MRIHRIQRVDYFRPQRFLHRHITRRYTEKKESNSTSPFTRNLQSNNPQAIRKYKRKLEVNINKFNIKERIVKLYNTVKLEKTQ